MLKSPQTATWLPILSNSLLVISKLAVGLAIGSLSVISDALDSGLDILSALVAFVSVRIAARPADASHPFGHGKAENLGTLIEALFITTGGVLITLEAVRRIRQGSELGNVDAGIAVMGFSLLLNLSVAFLLFRSARHTRSPAVEAAGRHRAADVLTSLAVLAGLVAVRITGITLLDPALALFVAFIILWTAVDMVRRAFGILMDRRLPAADETGVRLALKPFSGQMRLAHLHSRQAGRDRYFELTLVTCQHTSVGEAHRLTEEIESKTRGLFPGSQVVTHVEPCTNRAGCPCPADCPAEAGRAI